MAMPLPGILQKVGGLLKAREMTVVSCFKK
jgi:hypothetical protein